MATLSNQLIWLASELRDGKCIMRVPPQQAESSEHSHNERITRSRIFQTSHCKCASMRDTELNKISQSWRFIKTNAQVWPVVPGQYLGGRGNFAHKWTRAQTFSLGPVQSSCSKSAHFSSSVARHRRPGQTAKSLQWCESRRETEIHRYNN